MKKSVSVLLIAVMVLTVFSIALSNTPEAVQMSNSQLQNSIGGLPTADCAMLMVACAGAFSGSLWCILLAAICLIIPV